MDVMSGHHETKNGHENGSSHNNNGNGGHVEDVEMKEVKKEAYNSDDDVSIAELMRREKKAKVDKKRKAARSDSEDDVKPDITKKDNKKKNKKKKNESESEDEYEPEKPKKKKASKKEYSDSEEDYKPEINAQHDSSSHDRSDDNGTSNESDEENVSVTKEKKNAKKRKPKKELTSSEDEEEEHKNGKNKKKKNKVDKKTTPSKSAPKNSKTTPVVTKKKVKKEETLEDVWEWWKEDKKPAGVKWNSLGHKGPLFAPQYVALPDHIKFKYDGKTVKLSLDAEECAGFYAGVLDHEYSGKVEFNTNFMKDWRKVMTSKERELITDLKKCDFRAIDAYQKEQREIRKAMTKEEKLKIKLEKEEELKHYGVAMIDGHRQKIANFRIEPPGLFRGRGGHPKMGMLKKRINPEDVIINCSKDSEIPKPPAGHKWKEVRHDNTVSWLCSWTESVLGQNKYIMLNPSSKIKGEKDHDKYETARRLKKRIDRIRESYTSDFKSKEMRIRQRSVALYFIDKLALRAGNEKDVDEAADTVGCCSLRVEHVKLYDSEKLNDGDKHPKENVVEFDFLGKDSIRYFNRVSVEKRVYKNLKLFMENKNPADDLFDRLDTSTLNEHLRSLMDGLTVKVFRTYNASITLQDQLKKLTNPDDNIPAKILSYNRANRQVAILCNHQRAVPKTFEKSMEALEQKIKDKKKEVHDAEAALKGARGAEKEKAQKKLDKLKEALKKLKISRTDKDENKQIALGTSKLNYLDPRITVAWCKKYEVPLEKVFTKTHREKFRWAIDMTMNTDEEFIF